MALFDIFQEVTEKQVVKTEFGSERIFGAVIGIVAENYSEEMPGRLCVNIPVRDSDACQLKWAKMAMPYMGRGWGSYFLPEKEDQVLLVFEDGNIEKPFVVGCIPKDNDSYLKKTAAENNQLKQIQTRNGSRLTFFDDKEQEGSKDKITLSTAGNDHEISLDNEKKKILITDKKKHCRAEFMSEQGNINIHGEKSIKITVGDSITIKMNGESGDIKIDAGKVSIKAGKGIKLDTDGNAKFSGKTVTIEAASSLKAQSSGMLSLEGKPVKLG
ncbi:MAG: phage baseplate assembly protein V [Roseburia sp.]|nr:phage baseplate assembly protein V [Roseburia sp.]